jgi:hypothetical protein
LRIQASGIRFTATISGARNFSPVGQNALATPGELW